jgi:hypothetical protein
VENLWGDRKECKRQPSMVEKAVNDRNNYCITKEHIPLQSRTSSINSIPVP